MIRLALFPNENTFNNNHHFINTNPTTAIFINSNGGALPIRNFLQNITTNVGWTVGSQFVSILSQIMSARCNGIIYDDGLDSVINFPMFHFAYNTPSEYDDIVNTFSNFSLNVKLSASLHRNSSYSYAPYISACFDFSNIANSLLIKSSTSYNPSYYLDCENASIDICEELTGVSSGQLVLFSNYNNYYSFDVYNNNPYPPCGDVPSDCEDTRTSGATQMIDVVINGHVLDSPVQFNYSIGFTTPNSDSLHTESIPAQMQRSFTRLDNISANFSGGVIRDSGYLEIYGKLNGYGVGVAGGTIDLDAIEEEEILLGKFNFEPCCDCVDSSIFYYVDELENVMGDFSDFTGSYTITSYKWYGFKSLTNYCCDDVNCDCPQDTSIEIDDNDTIKGGSSSGGGDVDVTCICEALNTMNGKFDSIISCLRRPNEVNPLEYDTIQDSIDNVSGTLEVINQTIEDVDLSVEMPECICDNLELIEAGIEALGDGLALNRVKYDSIIEQLSRINASIQAVPVGINTNLNLAVNALGQIKLAIDAITNGTSGAVSIQNSLIDIKDALITLSGYISSGATALGTNLPALTTNLPALTTNLPALTTNLPALGLNLPAIATVATGVGAMVLIFEAIKLALEAIKDILVQKLTELDISCICDGIDDLVDKLEDAIELFKTGDGEQVQIESIADLIKQIANSLYKTNDDDTEESITEVVSGLSEKLNNIGDNTPEVIIENGLYADIRKTFYQDKDE